MQKTVLVVGSMGALGNAVVKSYQARNWNVLGADISATAPEYKYMKIATDASIPHMQSSLLQLVDKQPLHAVVNVAGGWAGGSIADPSTAAAAELMLRQSLFSSLAASHVFATCGTSDALLLLTGALAATGPTPGMIGYGVAKSAVHALCRSIADDPQLLPKGARVISILPVSIDTPANRAAMPDADRSTWTPVDVLSQRIVQWSEHDGQIPPSGSLVAVKTIKNDTTFDIV